MAALRELPPQDWVSSSVPHLGRPSPVCDEPQDGLSNVRGVVVESRRSGARQGNGLFHGIEAGDREVQAAVGRCNPGSGSCALHRQRRSARLEGSSTRRGHGASWRLTAFSASATRSLVRRSAQWRHPPAGQESLRSGGGRPAYSGSRRPRSATEHSGRPALLAPASSPGLLECARPAPRSATGGQRAKVRYRRA